MGFAIASHPWVPAVVQPSLPAHNEACIVAQLSGFSHFPPRLFSKRVASGLAFFFSGERREVSEIHVALLNYELHAYYSNKAAQVVGWSGGRGMWQES